MVATTTKTTREIINFRFKKFSNYNTLELEAYLNKLWVSLDELRNMRNRILYKINLKNANEYDMLIIVNVLTALDNELDRFFAPEISLKEDSLSNRSGGAKEARSGDKRRKVMRTFLTSSLAPSFNKKVKKVK